MITAAPPQPCTAATQRCATATSYGARLPDCCRGHLRQMMADIQVALDRAGLTWWMDYGTLLGAVRNPLTTAADYPWLTGLPKGPLAPGILPHDKDADLGVIGSDWERILRAGELIALAGYTVVPRKPARSLKVLLSPRNRTNVDLFSWHPAGSLLHRLTYIQVDQFKGRQFPTEWVRERPLLPWEDLMLPAPRDPEGFLRHRYGEHWRTPIPANHEGIRRA